MTTKELLTVQYRFRIIGRGLFLIPENSIVPKDDFERFNETVLVIRPDRTQQKYNARFDTQQFSMGDDGKWTVVLLIEDTAPDEIPEGSQVYGNAETFARLNG
ncbi:hypothetical protein QUF63_08730 [Anaerolineales bacterium HSG25]|nr:hypothetical protein [Anaerolineales bacterium HSG25]